MDNASLIKNTLSMGQVANHYGLKVNSRSFACCPFHNEKTPSMKIYEGNKGFSCFSCGESGSVIDFVMKLYKVNFQKAIAIIDNDFNLGISDKRPSLEAVKEYKQKQANKKAYQDSMKLVDEWWTLEFKKHYRNFRDLKPKYKFQKLDDRYIKALCELPYIEDKLAELGAKMCGAKK